MTNHKDSGFVTSLTRHIAQHTYAPWEKSETEPLPKELKRTLLKGPDDSKKKRTNTPFTVPLPLPSVERARADCAEAGGTHDPIAQKFLKNTFNFTKPLTTVRCAPPLPLYHSSLGRPPLSSWNSPKEKVPTSLVEKGGPRPLTVICPKEENEEAEPSSCAPSLPPAMEGRELIPFLHPVAIRNLPVLDYEVVLSRPLFHHQRIAITWMKWRALMTYSEPQDGMFLLDETGLGKTSTSIAFLLWLLKKHQQYRRSLPLKGTGNGPIHWEVPPHIACRSQEFQLKDLSDPAKLDLVEKLIVEATPLGFPLCVTRQTSLQSARRKLQILVVVHEHLLSTTWDSDVAAMLGEDWKKRAFRYLGKKCRSRPAQQLSSLIESHEWTYTSYSQLTTELKNYQKNKGKVKHPVLDRKFDIVVLDECGDLRNLKKKTLLRGIVIKLLKMRRVYFMAAQPIYNELSDLLSYFQAMKHPMANRKDLFELSSDMVLNQEQKTFFEGFRRNYVVRRKIHELLQTFKLWPPRKPVRYPVLYCPPGQLKCLEFLVECAIRFHQEVRIPFDSLQSLSLNCSSSSSAPSSSSSSSSTSSSASSNNNKDTQVISGMRLSLGRYEILATCSGEQGIRRLYGKAEKEIGVPSRGIPSNLEKVASEHSPEVLNLLRNYWTGILRSIDQTFPHIKSTPQGMIREDDAVKPFAFLNLLLRIAKDNPEDRVAIFDESVSSLNVIIECVQQQACTLKYARLNWDPNAEFHLVKGSCTQKTLLKEREKVIREFNNHHSRLSWNLRKHLEDHPLVTNYEEPPRDFRGRTACCPMIPFTTVESFLLDETTFAPSQVATHIDFLDVLLFDFDDWKRMSRLYGGWWFRGSVWKWSKKKRSMKWQKPLRKHRLKYRNVDAIIHVLCQLQEDDEVARNAHPNALLLYQDLRRKATVFWNHPSLAESCPFLLLYYLYPWVEPEKRELSNLSPGSVREQVHLHRTGREMGHEMNLKTILPLNEYSDLVVEEKTWPQYVQELQEQARSPWPPNYYLSMGSFKISTLQDTVLFLSSKFATSGYNLGTLRYIVSNDCKRTAADWLQAIGRGLRLGQERSLVTERFIVQYSPEDIAKYRSRLGKWTVDQYYFIRYEKTKDRKSKIPFPEDDPEAPDDYEAEGVVQEDEEAQKEYERLRGPPLAEEEHQQQQQQQHGEDEEEDDAEEKPILVAQTRKRKRRPSTTKSLVERKKVPKQQTSIHATNQQILDSWFPTWRP